MATRPTQTTTSMPKRRGMPESCEVCTQHYAYAHERTQVHAHRASADGALKTCVNKLTYDSTPSWRTTNLLAYGALLPYRALNACVHPTGYRKLQSLWINNLSIVIRGIRTGGFPCHEVGSQLTLVTLSSGDEARPIPRTTTFTCIRIIIHP